MNYTNPDFFALVGSIGAFQILRSRTLVLSASPTVGEHMVTSILPQILTRPDVVDVLVCIRQEWDFAAEGESLVEAQGSVGLLLADIVRDLGLSPAEQVLVLGKELYSDLQDILVVVPENGRGS